MVAFVAQLAIGIVFHDGNAVLVGEKNQLVATAFGQGDSGGILEVRQDVHEFRTSAETGIELIGEQAVVVDGDRNVLRAVNVEGLQCAQVGGSFDEDAVAAINEELADEVEGLLGTGCDENVFRSGDDAIAGKVAGNHFAQRLIAFGGAVLQGLGPVVGENLVAGFFEALHGEDVWRGQAAAEGDNFRLLRNFQEFTDRGAFYSQRSLGIPRTPKRGHTRNPPKPMFHNFNISKVSKIKTGSLETLKL